MKYCLISILLIFHAHQTWSSNMDDLLEALNDLDNFTKQKQQELDVLLNQQAHTLLDELDEIKSSTTQEILDQTEKISTKIQRIVDSVANTTTQNAGISNCLGTAQEDLQDFADELQEKLLGCYASMINEGNFKLYAIWSKVRLDYDFGYTCASNLVQQCQNYENEDCIESVLNFLQVSRKKTVERFHLLEADVINAIEGMSIPCKGIIMQDLILYSNLILKNVSDCLEGVIKIYFNSNCY